MAEHQSSNRQTRFVLVVDGNHRDLLYTSMILQNFGYHVTTLRLAEEVIDFLDVAVPSLVITELRLIGMSGLNLLARLRDNPVTKTVPVIIQTSIDDAETRAACARDGSALFLKKPVSAEDMYRAVQSAVEANPRRNLRIRTYLKVFTQAPPAPGEKSEEEFIAVLSEEGMHVKTLRPRPVNSRITVRFILNHEIVTVEAEVLYRFSFGEGPFREPGMGMKFVNVSSKDRMLIREYIDEQVKKGLARLIIGD